MSRSVRALPTVQVVNLSLFGFLLVWGWGDDRLPVRQRRRDLGVLPCAVPQARRREGLLLRPPGGLGNGGEVGRPKAHPDQRIWMPRLDVPEEFVSYTSLRRGASDERKSAMRSITIL